MIEQELGNLLPYEVPFATMLTMVEVDADDPGFANPTKFVGPVYDKPQADALAAEKGWIFKADGGKWRRVVPSPMPKHIFEMRPIRWLLEKGVVVVWPAAAFDDEKGGNGISSAGGGDRQGLLLRAAGARDDADLFIMATDAEAVFIDWGKPTAKAVRTDPASPRYQFGWFDGPRWTRRATRRATGKAAAGALKDLPAIVRGAAGTTITKAATASRGGLKSA